MKDEGGNIFEFETVYLIAPNFNLFLWKSFISRAAAQFNPPSLFHPKVGNFFALPSRWRNGASQLQKNKNCFVFGAI
jgi:hypothetical protein